MTQNELRDAVFSFIITEGKSGEKCLETVVCRVFEAVAVAFEDVGDLVDDNQKAAWEHFAKKVRDEARSG